MVFPFPTATLATYLREGGSDSHVAAAVYGVVVEGVALSFLAIMTLLIRRRLLDGDVSEARARAAARQYAGGAVAIAAAIALAFLSAIAALTFHMAIAMYFLAARSPFSKRVVDATEPAGHS
jgi:hypothetical protein